MLLIAFLCVAFFCIHYTLLYIDPPSFDVTTNKLHTLSDGSKDVLGKIDKNVEISAYGFTDKDQTFVGFGYLTITKDSGEEL